MPNGQVQTATKTKSVTNTKLAVATLALAIAAGGAAFAGAAFRTPGATYMCEETDAARDYSDKGYAVLENLDTGKKRTWKDKCVDGILYERYCRAGASGPNIYWLATDKHDCGPGYECSQGACVASTIPCSDSDGFDYTTRGTASGVSTSSEPIGGEETCVSDNEVLEYWCNDTTGHLDSIVHRCSIDGSQVCRDGACVDVIPPEGTATSTMSDLRTFWSPTNTYLAREESTVVGYLGFENTGPRDILLEVVNLEINDEPTYTYNATTTLELRWLTSYDTYTFLAERTFYSADWTDTLHTNFTPINFSDGPKLISAEGGVGVIEVRLDTRFIMGNSVSLRVNSTDIQWRDAETGEVYNTSDGLPLDWRTVNFTL